MASRHERDTRRRFEERYAVPTSDVTEEVERRVIGAAWGANGYTTLRQADELAARLCLAPGVRVLDVGTGRGWPGLYYAVRYGCAVVGTDVPFEALLAGSRRAHVENVGGRFASVGAAGSRQPFRQKSFDAVVHTDVLC
jgi:SAM-dependent methyltransferase